MKLLLLLLPVALLTSVPYIVLLKDHVSFEQHMSVVANSFATFSAQDNKVLHVYSLAKGYAAIMSESVRQQVYATGDVDRIEKNQIYSIATTQLNTPSWGLPRISSHAAPNSKDYNYLEPAGAGVDVYVVDTGVNIHHEDFNGNAKWGITVPQGEKDTDGQGHGTHVASTIAGTRFGVAKKATIHAVKVLKDDGSGNLFDVIKGIDWVAQQSGSKKVINMSLGGPKSFILDIFVEKAVMSGVHVAVAAGNSNEDACNFSPASARGVICAGASDINDQRAFFSNYGKCVHVFAPGLNITAAWIGSDSANRTISGTSMASPHVAGVVALLLAQEDGTPEELKARVVDLATPNKLSNIGSGSPNLLLFNGYQSSNLKLNKKLFYY